MDNEIKEMLEDSICCKYELHTSEKKTLLNYIIKLQKKKKNRISESLSYDLAKARVKELEHRIDKAIEYIEKRDFVEVEIDNEPFNMDFDFKENILNILRGEDNE